MKKLFILFVLPLAIFTSCGSSVDDAVNDLTDTLFQFGETTATIDGNTKDFNNYSGYQTVGNTTVLYFADIKLSTTSADAKGEAIVCILNNDEFTAGNSIDISLTGILTGGLSATKLQTAFLYLNDVSAQDVVSLVSLYTQKDANLETTLEQAESFDYTIRQASLLNFQEILTGDTPNLKISIDKSDGKTVDGTFSFTAFGTDGSKTNVTAGSFKDIPNDNK
ncbi:hypothetical protein [Flammeovirga aprica]|uniref:DUF5689 domain-containing protein n=1 Tax=Flammeovirga aprica JL-4 TaxID=694437 RepID=A0A7X9RUE4_9BACT|nr:hypothetical protein [Flammeovirga aprica]NME68902.1 hypothetical protein [Flammeovirga aprica JL-4]